MLTTKQYRKYERMVKMKIKLGAYPMLQVASVLTSVTLAIVSRVSKNLTYQPNETGPL